MWVKKNNRSYEVYFDTPQSYTKGVLSFNGNEGYKVEKKELRSRKEPGQLSQVHSKENILNYTPSDSDLHIKTLFARYDVSPVVGKFMIKKRMRNLSNFKLVINHSNSRFIDVHEQSFH